MARSVLICTILAALYPCCPAWGLELTPFAVRNLSPPVLTHSLTVPEPARLSQAGQLVMRLGFELASNASINDSGGEVIVLDGETYVTTLGMRYGLPRRLQVGFDLPYIKHSGGHLDGFIEGWHDFFDLPNSDRDRLPDDELTNAYADGSGKGFSIDDNRGRIGDLSAMLAWQWLADQQLAASLHATVKAPTGDAEDLTGSGGWDLSLALSAQRDFVLERGDVSLWGGLGISWLGSGDLLDDRAENWVASGWLGSGWSPFDWLGFKLQLNTHTALYDSELRELGDPAAILTMGGSLGFGAATTLDIGVGEDLAVNASPDVTFHLLLAHRF
ncbi:MAG: hypothetical protein C0614_10360 [Desulfuromonas sp.]|nr:MAG: hypothetical protein C0614_10360 [Desulfuromonas sp.]